MPTGYLWAVGKHTLLPAITDEALLESHFQIPQEGQRITQDWGELWPAAMALVSCLQQQTGP